MFLQVTAVVVNLGKDGLARTGELVIQVKPLTVSCTIFHSSCGLAEELAGETPPKNSKPASSSCGNVSY